MKALVIAGVASDREIGGDGESFGGKREDSIRGVLPFEAVAGLSSRVWGSLGKLEELEGREKDRKSGGGSKPRFDFMPLPLLFVDMLSLSSLAAGIVGTEGGGILASLLSLSIFCTDGLGGRPLGTLSLSSPPTTPCRSPSPSLSLLCSFRLATLKMGGSIGGAKLTLPLVPGLSLSPILLSLSLLDRKYSPA